MLATIQRGKIQQGNTQKIAKLENNESIKTISISATKKTNNEESKVSSKKVVEQFDSQKNWYLIAVFVE